MLSESWDDGLTMYDRQISMNFSLAILSYKTSIAALEPLNNPNDTCDVENILELILKGIFKRCG
jgi:hypothetical protein